MAKNKNTADRTKKREIKSSRLIDISAKEARAFLLRGKQYCTFDLPEYFKFDAVLQEVQELIGDTGVDHCLKSDADFSACNHILISNKDGGYAMRPLSLSHPVLYYLLVRELTVPKAWRQLKKTIRKQRQECILVASHPLIPKENEAFKASTTILNWWHNVEQLSIELSLDYTYMLSTDISNCYGCIDSRTLVQILPKNLASKIVPLVQMLQGGIAVGLPQGAVLYDFLAEIILGELDVKLSEYLKKQGLIDGYYIIRYRDDYRIFGNDKMIIQSIFSTLQQILLETNCHLGASKTHISRDLVLSAIKKDKLYYLENTPIFNKKGCDFDSVQKHLIYILLFSKKHPNGGQLCAMLSDLTKRIKSDNIYWDKSSATSLSAVVVALIRTNPRLCVQGIELLRMFTEYLNFDERKHLFERIKKRLIASNINNVFSQVWLQYLTIAMDTEADYTYDAPLCLLAEGHHVQLWGRKCLRGKYAKYDYERSLCNAVEIKQNTPQPISHRATYDYNTWLEVEEMINGTTIDLNIFDLDKNS